MLLYAIFLSCIAIFFFKEGKALKSMSSRLLPDFMKEPLVAQTAAKHIFLISYCSALSAAIMFFTLVYRELTNTHPPRFLIAMSFLIYGLGFMIGMYRCYKLKKELL